jgi:hypothetical protein
MAAQDVRDDEYTCAACGGVFGKGWSDEEAAAESVELFGEWPAEQMAVVCDDCFNKMVGWKHPQDWRAEQDETLARKKGRGIG